MVIFQKNKKPCIFYCAGGGSFNEYEKKMFEKLGIENQIIQFNLMTTLLHIYIKMQYFLSFLRSTKDLGYRY